MILYCTYCHREIEGEPFEQSSDEYDIQRQWHEKCWKVALIEALEVVTRKIELLLNRR